MTKKRLGRHMKLNRSLTASFSSEYYEYNAPYPSNYFKGLKIGICVYGFKSALQDTYVYINFSSAKFELNESSHDMLYKLGKIDQVNADFSPKYIAYLTKLENKGWKANIQTINTLYTKSFQQINYGREIIDLMKMTPIK